MNPAAKATAAAARGGAAGQPAILRAASCFHSTPVSERKRRTYWNSDASSFSSKKFNHNAKRNRKFDSKRTSLRNISEYAEYLFQSWKPEDKPDDDPTWFKKQYCSGGTRRYDFSSREPRQGSYSNRRFEFCASDDEEIETIFRSAFRGEQGYYWSFSSSKNFDSANFCHRSSWEWRDEPEDETDTSPQSDLTSERRALGLRASGPLKLEEVKSAYRACALRWHPDRHQGSTKAAAEEKFKYCSAAYKSLCDQLVAA